jgi:hypothetical protein
VALAGCAGDEPHGLAPTPAGSGALIVYEPLARPDPILPLPNDSATRLVDDSPTGRRLNLFEESPLAAERRFREKLNTLDGWSVVAPISVSFSAPIDPKTATAETVLVYDVTPGSPEFGRRVALDFGESYPIALPSAHAVFPGDPAGDLPDFLFPHDNDVDGERLPYYEVETNTLMFRPLIPLRPATTYAVVLTRGLLDAGGKPVRSPFPYVNDARQTSALRPVVQWVDGGADNIAFAWKFTTQDVARTLTLLRQGLDGQGPFGWLQEYGRPRFDDFTNLDVESDGDGTLEAMGIALDPQDHLYILQAEFLAYILQSVGSLVGGLDNLTYENLDYFVLGELSLPDLRSASTGVLMPDPQTGFVDFRMARVPFAIAVPKATPQHQPPFPVVIYSHGARTSRLEMALIADTMAKHGLAMATIDAAGHGPFGGDLRAILKREASGYPPELVNLLISYLGGLLIGPEYKATGKTVDEALGDLEDVGLWHALFVAGRSQDADGDGVRMSGDSYFVGDAWKLRSAGQQTIVDTMSWYRLLRSLDGSRGPTEPLADPGRAPQELLFEYMRRGDFNADGKVDVGGPDVPYFVAGTSLGGIHTSVLMAVEPGLGTGVPIVSGGGMTDILLRTSLDDTADVVLTEALGLTLVGCAFQAEEDGPIETSLAWNLWSLRCRDAATIAMADEQAGLERFPLLPGGKVRLENPRLFDEGGEWEEDARVEVVIDEQGQFSASVPADRGDLLLLTVSDESGAVLHEASIYAPQDGLGRRRNTPRFRRLIQTAQVALDAGDPLAYARHLIREPLPGTPPRNVLHITDVGDKTVPFSTMVAWDRAVGLFGLDEEDAIAINQAFIDHDAMIPPKPLWDVDNQLGPGDGIGPLPPIATESGVSAVRYYANDDHEFIAQPDPSAPFDFATFARNQLIYFFLTGGAEVSDDMCLEDSTCDWHLEAEGAAP